MFVHPCPVTQTLKDANNGIGTYTYIRMATWIYLLCYRMHRVCYISIHGSYLLRLLSFFSIKPHHLCSPRQCPLPLSSILLSIQLLQHFSS
jgi:hypothetical protein